MLVVSIAVVIKDHILFKAMQMYYLMVLEVRNRNSFSLGYNKAVGRSVLPGVLRGKTVFLHFQVLVVTSIPWLVSLPPSSMYITSVSASVITLTSALTLNSSVSLL